MEHKKMTIIFRPTGPDTVQTLYLSEEGNVDQGLEQAFPQLIEGLCAKFVFQDGQVEWIRTKLAAGQSCWTDAHVK